MSAAGHDHLALNLALSATGHKQLALRSARRIAVFRALQLGDMLCVVPALRSLRAGCPHAQITLIGLAWAREFAERFDHYVDRFIEFPGHPRMPEAPARPDRWAPYLETVRARGFDFALQLHGDGSLTNRLIADIGASRSAGFHPGTGMAPDADTYLAWREQEHEVTRYVRLMRHLGLPDCGSQLEWPHGSRDDSVQSLVDGLRARGPFVVVHPGARLSSRRWPVERFAHVADRLAEHGFTIVITGAADERELGAALRAAVRRRRFAIDLTGKTDLGGVATLVAHAALTICNDTGISHITAAVGTPSVVICCGADPLRWAPLDASRHAVLFHAIACRPCMHRECPIGHACATAVSPQAVYARALDMLSRHAPGPIPTQVS